MLVAVQARRMRETQRREKHLNRCATPGERRKVGSCRSAAPAAVTDQRQRLLPRSRVIARRTEPVAKRHRFPEVIADKIQISSECKNAFMRALQYAPFLNIVFWNWIICK
jgi:hypothetical protein